MQDTTNVPTGTPAGTPTGGRPRRADVEPRAYRATVELVAERGYEGTTLDLIAAHAGLAKTTLYRRWPSKGTLAVGALMSLMGAPAVLTEPGSGSAPTRVRESIGWLAEQVARPEVRLLLLGIVAEAARDERARAALRSRFREPVVAGFVRTFDLDPERVDLTFDLVVGTLLHRATMSDQVTPDDAAVVTGLAMRTLFPDAAD